ncbi:MAG: hypothetical protein JST38_20240 [Bacteroidetes bacterium]|nr:hypothetical protein [Bacteroidota bacterium]
MVPTLHVPGHERQAERLTPQFQTLQAAFEARRLELQAAANNSDPDLVVVFETVGAVGDFISSAERIPAVKALAGTSRPSRNLVLYDGLTRCDVSTSTSSNGGNLGILSVVLAW